jgi:hypothetical protein
MKIINKILYHSSKLRNIYEKTIKDKNMHYDSKQMEIVLFYLYRLTNFRS